MSALWGHLQWHRPLWLAVAALPWLAWLWQRRRGPGGGALARYADPRLWPWILIGKARPRHLAPVAAAWLLAAAAAAGPQWLTATQSEQERRGIDILVVADISPSMLVADVAPNRLKRLKLELRDFVAMLHGDRIGLVPFSANAYLTLPLSHDKDAFLYFVDALDPGLVSKTGSDLPRALDLARTTLQATGLRGRAIVLLTDGENHGPDTAAAAGRLAAAHIPLYILGMGTPAGGPVPDPQGQFLQYRGKVVDSRLNRGALRHLAAVTGGAYADLDAGDADWRALFAAMRRDVPENRYSITTSDPAMPLFPWLLAASLAVFLLAGGGTRGGPVLASLCAALLLPMAAPRPAYAWPWQEQAALRALQGGDYAAAAGIYRGLGGYVGRLGAGAAAYRLQDYATARKAFQDAAAAAADAGQLATAEYDLGNAYARLEEFDKAADAYRRALRARPDFPHAALNLTLVNGRQQQRLGNRASATAKRSLHDMRGSSTDTAAPLTAAAGTTPSSGRSPPGHGGRGGSGDTPPVQERPPDVLQAWRLKSGVVDRDLSAILEQLQSLDARPNALMSYLYRDDDVRAGILPQEKPW